MASTVKKGDFIEFDFIGKTKAQNKIFDLTLADVAKKEGIFDEKQKYVPMIVCLGHGQLLAGLDKFIEGKEIGKEYTVDIKAEEAFGARNPKLVKITNVSAFKDQKVPPMPGMQFSIDGSVATIRSVNGGRVIIDFNHPLSGKELNYWVKIKRVVDKPEEKLDALTKLLFKISDAKIEVSEKEVVMDFKAADKFPAPLAEAYKKEIDNLIPELKNKKLVIGKEKKEQPKEAKPEAKAAQAPKAKAKPDTQSGAKSAKVK